MKITVLPPGEARGARDLQRWSHRRTLGYSGMPTKRKEERKWQEKERKKRRYLDDADRWLARNGGVK